MKTKMSILIVAAISLASCTTKEQETPKDVSGYVVHKEYVKAHCDTTEPVVLQAGFYGSSHASSHSSHSFHSSSHSYSHSSYHSSNHSSHPMYHNSYHPIYHPIIYGYRPYHRSMKINDEEVTWIATEFDIYVANKYSIHKVSVDSMYFVTVKRGEYVKFKDGKPIK